MSPEDEREQEEIHAALARLIPDLGEGCVLTGWIVVYEYQEASDRPSAGHVYGPAGMTTWRAMGLCEWARSVTLKPGEEDDE